MDEDLLISVIIPVYKVEKYINKCIESIVNQTYSNLQIILVDDGSPDNCPKICDEWAKKDDRITVIHKINGGLSDARNAGLIIAKGDYISFIDSDDYIDLHMYENMIRIAILESSEIVSCGIKIVNENRKTDNARINQEIKYNLYSDKECMRLLVEDKEIGQTVWNKLYKKEVINNIFFDIGKYHEDVFWLYKIIGNSSKICIIQQEYYNYLQRDGSIMNESYSKKRLDALDAIESRCEYIKINYPKLYNISLIKYVCSCMYHYQLICKEVSDNSDIYKNNIKSRLKKIKKIKFEDISIKDFIWIKCFILLPDIISMLRNKLKIGF